MLSSADGRGPLSATLTGRNLSRARLDSLRHEIVVDELDHDVAGGPSFRLDDLVVTVPILALELAKWFRWAVPFGWGVTLDLPKPMWRHDGPPYLDHEPSIFGGIRFKVKGTPARLQAGFARSDRKDTRSSPRCPCGLLSGGRGGRDVLVAW
jgi:hypothetical protein